MKTITLTDEQAEKLDDALSEYTDDGPTGFGWPSDELTELREVISAQINTKD